MKPPVVAGKYTLLRRLGAGGMAEVFLAKQASEGGFEKLVVLKRILPHLASGREFTAMFLDEARIAADLRHPNIVTIVDTGRAGDSLFMVMEFLHGQDVRKLQRKVAAFGQQIPFGHACQVVIDAAAGLHYAHTKRDLNGRLLEIVHRDVSPQNILVTFEGSTKIVDFGIAKAVGQSSHTSTGVLKGKYTYMSPEQAEGQVVDARTDQYALGIVFWELLTMRRLFKRDTETATLEAIVDGNVPRPRRFREDCPAALEDVVMMALARDKHRRFRDCEELALALEDALAKESIVHSPSRLSQYMRRLFADQLAEEAALGVVAPDGSLSVRNTFSAAEKRSARSAGDGVEPAAAPPAAAVVVDATQADRRRGASRSADVEPALPRRDTGPRSTSQSAVLFEPRSPRDEKPAAAASVAREPRPGSEAKPAPVAEEPRAAKEPLEPRDARETKEPVAPLAREPTRTRASTVDTPPAAAPPSPPAASPATMRSAVIAGGVGFGAVVAIAVGVKLFSATPGPANLVVRSEPRGARVYLDGIDTQQTTPALLRGVRSGEPHRVHIELVGHVPVDEVVTIPGAGETHELRLELTPVR
jgi:serine/threonine protein kinase